MYEYTTLPNSWEEQNLAWEHDYEQYLGSEGPSRTEFEMMCITTGKIVEVMAIEEEFCAARMPEDVYNVYLRRHYEGRDLSCQPLI